jgi:hypothetical protein
MIAVESRLPAQTAILPQGQDSWERNREQLKAIDRSRATQHRVAALKNPEHPQIDKQKNLGTRRVFQRPCGNFRALARSFRWICDCIEQFGVLLVNLSQSIASVHRCRAGSFS